MPFDFDSLDLQLRPLMILIDGSVRTCIVIRHLLGSLILDLEPIHLEYGRIGFVSVYQS